MHVHFTFLGRTTDHRGISNHRQHNYLFKHLLNPTSKKTSKPALLAFFRGVHRWPVDPPTKDQSHGKRFHKITSWVRPRITWELNETYVVYWYWSPWHWTYGANFWQWNSFLKHIYCACQEFEQKHFVAWGVCENSSQCICRYQIWGQSIGKPHND